MGLTFIEGQDRRDAGQEETVEFLVDGGAAYSLLPLETWRSVAEPDPYREEWFVLADGTAVNRNASFCYLALPQSHGYMPVVLGEPGDDQALLGPIALGNVGLMLNPFSRTLYRLRLPWRR